MIGVWRDLNCLRGIVDRPVTSLALEVARSENQQPLPDLENMAHRAARQFGFVFQQQVLAVESLDALRAQAKASSQKSQFPAEDTPLHVPPEIERLRGGKPRPVSA